VHAYLISVSWEQVNYTKEIVHGQGRIGCKIQIEADNYTLAKKQIEIIRAHTPILWGNCEEHAHIATLWATGISLEGLQARLIGSITDPDVKHYFLYDFDVKGLALKIDNLKQEIAELLGADLAALDLISFSNSN
jgi:hypothetical protein